MMRQFRRTVRALASFKAAFEIVLTRTGAGLAARSLV